MLLYHPGASIAFPQFGINIPSLPSRFPKTMEALLKNPALAPVKDRWFLQDIPPQITRDDLTRAHDKDYVDSLYSGGLEKALLQAYELIDSKGQYHRYHPEKAERPLIEILDVIMMTLAGSFHAIEIAREQGFCYYLGGGMHHAHPGFGHGFCLLNDVAVAVLKAQAQGLFKTAWVIDVDAHRGDGTADILQQNPFIKTLSIHMARGWPLDSPERYADGTLNPAWIPGDADIGISPGEEKEYLPRLMTQLDKWEQQGLPEFALVLGGVDPYEKDELPSTDPIALTAEQLFQRDRQIYQWLQQRNIPSAWVAAGGYGASSWKVHSAFLEWVLTLRLGL